MNRRPAGIEHTGAARAGGCRAGGQGLRAPKINDIRAIETQPGNARLTVVKILADEDGLYGYGCATFTQRAELVRVAERYLKPLLLGKTADRIEDIWQTAYLGSYREHGRRRAVRQFSTIVLWTIAKRHTAVRSNLEAAPSLD